MFIAAHDLLFIVGRDQVSHHGAHHIVERDHADHQAVFVEDGCKVFMHLLKLVQHFGQRELVGHDENFADQTVIFERNGLVIQHALKQVLGIHIANDVINITIADGVGGKGLFSNPSPDDMVWIVAQKVSNAVAWRHGRGHGA